ncbi:MAG TPA: M10 family metallopeptidase C-terminal domain-containing protein, partial [Brevundimonas sp.]
GSVLGFMDGAADAGDIYKVNLVAGQYYEFQVSGGWDAEAGVEGDLRLSLYGPNGLGIFSNNDISSADQNSAMGFVATVTGTYFLQVRNDATPAAGSSPTSGYELNVITKDISALSPLDAINWGGDDNVVPGAADGEIKVYFAGVGETFWGVTSLGWNDYEKQQAMLAFDQYEKVLPVNFVITDSAADADFKLVTKNTQPGETPGILGRMGPPGTGENAGVAIFWRDGFGWNEEGGGGLQQGGYAGFNTLVHEFGHGMGLSHPHDNGGGSAVMPGVFGPFDHVGASMLNQGIYTVMTYNPGWRQHPDGLFTVPVFTTAQGTFQETQYGYTGGLSALDIAVLQNKYGANESYNTGDNTYVLPSANQPGTFFTTIWDAGGTDTIQHDGAGPAQIDLTAATLDYSATGGGGMSFARTIYGGFTIANGVVIENATGGSGDDVLIGNSADNVLNGRGGVDTVSYERAANGVTVSLAVLGAQATGGAGADTLIDVENLSGSKFDDTLTGNGGNNILAGGLGNDVLDGA